MARRADRDGDNTYSKDPYVPYRWHHIVGQINRDRIELFKDGELSASLSIRPEHGDVPCHLVLGRLTVRPGSGGSIDRPFIGRMDEVAVYDRPLTARGGPGPPSASVRGFRPSMTRAGEPVGDPGEGP